MRPTAFDPATGAFEELGERAPPEDLHTGESWWWHFFVSWRGSGFAPSFVRMRGRVPEHLAYPKDGGDGLGEEPHATDGTRSGTIMLADVWPGEGSSSPSVIGHHEGVTYFAATSPAEGRELWATDGTRGGTRLLAELEPDEASSSPLRALVLDGRLFVWLEEDRHPGTTSVFEVLFD